MTPFYRHQRKELRRRARGGMALVQADERLAAVARPLDEKDRSSQVLVTKH